MAAASPQLLAEKGMDVVESILVYSWKMKDFEKKLNYDLHKCIGCGLCEKVCPVNAIMMGPVIDVANGKLQETPLIDINYEKCCYCFLCAAICPTAAMTITVLPEGKIDLGDFPGVGLWFEIDKKKCVEGADPNTCQACAAAVKENSIKVLQPLLEKCPKGALRLRSPFEGEVRLYRAQLHRCDLSNCKACITLCPSKAISVPQKADEILKQGKIAVDQNKCILCGACEACPEHLFQVLREGVEINQKSKIFSWTKAWTAILNDLIAIKQKTLTPQEKPVPVLQLIPEKPISGPSKKPVPLTPAQVKTNLDIAAKANILLSQAKVRRWMEQGETDKIKAEIQKTLKKEKK